MRDTSLYASVHNELEEYMSKCISPLRRHVEKAERSDPML